MWKTAIFLIFSLIVVPIIAFYYGKAPNEIQIQAIITTLNVYLIASIICFLVSTLTNNHSQVDKLWSIMPIIYAWIIAYYGDFTPRMILIASLISLWGIRLTYNFSRRGGYSWKFWSGDEDYRWSVLRKKPEFKSTWKWVLFNLFFISLYQMGLILLITFPMIKAIGGSEINLFDYILAALVIFFIITETIADQQQWNYQKTKHRLIKEGKKLTGIYSKGFVHTGLWSIVRHPNYASEQAIWIVMYFFSVSATGQWLNWSIVGCLLLVILFKGSSDFSEAITNKKYSEYEQYKKITGRFFPYFGSKK
ncbi:MAG: DUF1295 domain-containing protein [Brumimicrobium sp.]